LLSTITCTFFPGSSRARPSPRTSWRSSLLAQISRLYPLYLDPSKKAEKVLSFVAGRLELAVTISKYLYGAYGGNYESCASPTRRRGSLFLSFFQNLSLLLQYALELVSGEFNYTLSDIVFYEVDSFADLNS